MSKHPRPAPTLDEVAKHAGVSRATASRVVNADTKVSPSARDKVEASIAALGYVPNHAARSLVTRRTESVAVVLPEPNERLFADPFFARTLRVADAILYERKRQLVLLMSSQRGGKANDMRLASYLRNGHVDGALVLSHHQEDTWVSSISATGLPTVFVGRPWTAHESHTYVDTDNVAGGSLATRHLIDQGRTAIGHVAGPAGMTPAVDRRAGWAAALESAGLRADAVAHAEFSSDGGYQAAKELFAEHPDLDAVFAASDLMAVGAIRYLREVGKQVGTDVAVVGYDDIGVAEEHDPPLTTVHHPINDMVAQATTLLLDEIDEKRPHAPMRAMFQPRLVVRESA